MNCQLLHGDCLHIMPWIPASSIDTIITDPPYGLKFMGKEWDHGVPGVPFWEAALRVAKPGALLLAFGGTRTHHRLMVAIEDAGWEIRDCCMWLYGSGFPKSHDISKAIDKAAGAEREVIGIEPGHEEFASRSTTGHIEFKDGTEGFDRPWMHDSTAREKYHQLTAPATEMAAQWQGWGTALKPSWEPIIVAMKPLDGTFANNAQAHGVAGLNIDGCRIATAPGDELTPRNNKIGQNGWKNSSGGLVTPSPLGRWPANVLLDAEAAGRLDAQNEVGKSSAHSRHNNRTIGGNGKYSGGVAMVTGGHDDRGGPSRFFYTAKASKSERGEGNNHPTVKPLALMEYLCRLTATPTGGTVLDPFMGSGTTGIACALTGRSFVGIEKHDPYFEIAEERILPFYGI